MLQNYLSKLVQRPVDFKIWMGIALPVWVFVGFMLAQVIAGLLLNLLNHFGITFEHVNEAIFQSVLSVFIYLSSFLLVIGLPWLIKKYQTSRNDLALDSTMTWADLLLAPAAFIVYILLSFILTTIAMYLPFYNADQVQETGFAQLTQGYEYVLAFLTLVIIAPVSEEILFRGYLLGKLKKHLPIWASILITSLLFAIVHFQFNVGVDVFALSIVLCLLRIGTKRLWPSILLHMIKNGIAFFFLFINPLL